MFQIILKGCIIVRPISQQVREMMGERIQQFDDRLVIVAIGWSEQEAQDDPCQTHHTVDFAAKILHRFAAADAISVIFFRSLEKQKAGAHMHIQELSLQTHHLAKQKEFYSTTLGLPLLAETADSFMVQAGTTRLRFQATQQDVLYHVAFTIPRNTFTQAKSWLQKRVPLLDKDDEDEIFFAGINARSLYFCDAANNILEFIVHYDLDSRDRRNLCACCYTPCERDWSAS